MVLATAAAAAAPRWRRAAETTAIVVVAGILAQSAVEVAMRAPHPIEARSEAWRTLRRTARPSVAAFVLARTSPVLSCCYPGLDRHMRAWNCHGWCPGHCWVGFRNRCSQPRADCGQRSQKWSCVRPSRSRRGDGLYCLCCLCQSKPCSSARRSGAGAVHWPASAHCERAAACNPCGRGVRPVPSVACELNSHAYVAAESQARDLLCYPAPLAHVAARVSGPQTGFFPNRSGRAYRRARSARAG